MVEEEEVEEEEAEKDNIRTTMQSSVAMQLFSWARAIVFCFNT